MKILAIHRYYWPDAPPYASMLRAIVRRWVEDGHTVDVLSSQPSYKQHAGNSRQKSREMLDGATVFRLDLPPEHGRPLTRIVNILRMSVAVLRHAVRHGPYDAIMVSTAPPVVLGASACWASTLTGARLIYHCMDIHPEIGRISGEFRNPILFSLLQRIDKRTCRKAERVIVLSEDMARAIRQRSNHGDPDVRVINNFDLPTFDSHSNTGLPSDLHKPHGCFRVLFAGNVGRFQGLDAVIDAMHMLSDRADIELLFLGEGRAIGDLKTRAGNLLGHQIRFHPHQPVEVARQIIRSADLCLVTLAPQICKYAYPSKTMTYLGEGRPLLVSVEDDSDLANFVLKEQIGVTVSPGDAQGIAAIIREMADNPARQEIFAANATRAHARNFSQKEVLRHWSELIQDLEASSR